MAFFDKQKKQDEALEEIRGLYNQYLIEFGKTPKVRDAFEDRYLEALRSRKNLKVFYEVEKAFIQERIQAAGEEKQNQWNERVEEIKHGNEESYGDKMIRQLEERMQKYPRVEVHPHAMEDIEYLLGAIQLLFDTHWLALAKVIRSRSDYVLKQSYRDLDEKMYRLTASNKDVPDLIRDYQLLLARGATSRELNKGVRSFFLEAGRFLHELEDLIGELLDKAEDRESQENETVLSIRDFTAEVIKSFRLKDIGR